VTSWAKNAFFGISFVFFHGLLKGYSKDLMGFDGIWWDLIGFDWDFNGIAEGLTSNYQWSVGNRQNISIKGLEFTYERNLTTKWCKFDGIWRTNMSVLE
jgi:hypothetical protein